MIHPPYYIQGKGYTSREDRNLFGSVIGDREQVFGSGLATTAGPGMNTTTAAGKCSVKGDTNPLLQGFYHFWSDADEVRLHAADPTNPRVNLIVARVYDANEVGSGSNAGDIEIVQGTPQSGASLTNLASWPTVPNSAFPIAAVRVGAAASSIAGGDIKDLRPASDRLFIAPGGSLPSSPRDGQEVYAKVSVAGAGAQVVWHLRYQAATSWWDFVGGAPLVDEQLFDRSTVSTTFADIGAFALTAPFAGDYDIRLETISFQGAASVRPIAGLSIGGAAPAAFDQSWSESSAGNVEAGGVITRRKTLTVGQSVSVQYKTNTGTGDFKGGSALSLRPVHVTG